MSGLTTRFALVLAAIVLCVAAVGCTTSNEPAPSNSGATSGQASTSGQALAESKCTLCHTYDRVEQAKKDEAGWTSTIDRMVDHGLVITDAEKTAILEYLVAKGQ